MSRASVVTLLALVTSGCITPVEDTSSAADAALDERLDALEADLAALQSDHDDLRTDHDALRLEHDALRTEHDALVAVVDALPSDLKDAVTMADVEGYLVGGGYVTTTGDTDLDARLADYAPTSSLGVYATVKSVVAVDASVTELDGRVGTLEAVGADSRLAAVEASVATNTSDVASLDMRVGDLEMDALTAATLGDHLSGAGALTADNYADYVDYTYVGGLGFVSNLELVAYGFTTAEDVEEMLLPYATTADLGLVEASLSDLDAEAVRIIDTDQSFDIPGDFADLQEGIAWLETVAVPQDVTITFNLVSASYSLTEPVYAPVRNGQSMHIVGAGAGVTTINLVGSDGFVAEAGTAFGLIDGVMIVGDKSTGQEGVAAWYGGYIRLGSDVHLEAVGETNSGAAVVARRGGMVYAEYVTIGDPDIGFFANEGGFIDAVGSTVDGADRFGFFSGNGATLVAEYASSDFSGGAGFRAESGGFLAARGSYSTNAGDSGFASTTGGVMMAQESVGEFNYRGYEALAATLVANTSEATSNADAGYLCSRGSTCYLSEAVSTSNSLYGFVATTGTAMDAEKAQAISNGRTGFSASHGSVLIAAEADSLNNGDFGFAAGQTSYVWAYATDSSGNTGGAYEVSAGSEGTGAVILQ